MLRDIDCMLEIPISTYIWLACGIKRHKTSGAWLRSWHVKSNVHGLFNDTDVKLYVSSLCHFCIIISVDMPLQWNHTYEVSWGYCPLFLEDRSLCGTKSINLIIQLYWPLLSAGFNISVSLFCRCITFKCT